MLPPALDTALSSLRPHSAALCVCVCGGEGGEEQTAVGQALPGWNTLSPPHLAPWGSWVHSAGRGEHKGLKGLGGSPGGGL